MAGQARTSCELFTSELVLAEASAGDPTAARLRLEALTGLTSLPFTDEAILHAAKNETFCLADIRQPAGNRISADEVVRLQIPEVSRLRQRAVGEIISSLLP